MNSKFDISTFVDSLTVPAAATRVVGYLAEVDGKIAFQYDLEWQ